MIYKESLQEKQELRTVAAALRREREEQVRGGIRGFKAQRKQVVEDQVRRLDKQGCVNHVRSAAFSPVDIDAALVLLGSPQYSAMVVPATSLVQAPGPPSPNVVFF